MDSAAWHRVDVDVDVDEDVDVGVDMHDTLLARVQCGIMYSAALHQSGGFEVLHARGIAPRVEVA